MALWSKRRVWKWRSSRWTSLKVKDLADRCIARMFTKSVYRWSDCLFGDNSCFEWPSNGILCTLNTHITYIVHSYSSFASIMISVVSCKAYSVQTHIDHSTQYFQYTHTLHQVHAQVFRFSKQHTQRCVFKHTYSVKHISMGHGGMERTGLFGNDWMACVHGDVSICAMTKRGCYIACDLCNRIGIICMQNTYTHTQTAFGHFCDFVSLCFANIDDVISIAVTTNHCWMRHSQLVQSVSVLFCFLPSILNPNNPP